MGYLEIRCHTCGAVYQLHHEHIKPTEEHHCPHCYARINGLLWKQLAEAFFAMEEANQELRKDHAELGHPLMQAEFRTHYVPDAVISTNLGL